MKTMEYGLIGEKLGHSFSKEIHEKTENYTYSLLELKREEVGEFITKKDFSAINVTIPYKEIVIPYLDYVSDRAREIGSVNTIVNKDGKLYGYNTDCLGLKAMIERAGIVLDGKKVLILGSGGTAKTALVVAKQMGASKVICVSRYKKEECITYDEAIANHNDAEIIINTTPVGMYPDLKACPIDIDLFPNLSGVADVIYNPLRTSLVTKALKKGIKAAGGLYMLISQAIFAMEKFLGKSYEEETFEKLYNELNSSKENIVLIGMPSCGKTTVGKKISEITGRKFIDTDEMIEKSHNMKISDIFSKYGEKTFRDWETESVFEASKGNGCVISVGGGAILREENEDFLKHNGKLYFLDRKLSDLQPTDDRPLSSDIEALKKRYEERYPIYESKSDVKIEIDTDAENIAKRIACLHMDREGEKK